MSRRIVKIRYLERAVPKTGTSAAQLAIPDPMRLLGFGAEALPFVFLVLRIIAVEPVHPAVAFEGEDVGVRPFLQHLCQMYAVALTA